MLGSKKPLGYEMLGHRQPLGKNMIGYKSPLEHIPKMNVQTQQLEQQKKTGGLERARRNVGSKLGQWA